MRACAVLVSGERVGRSGATPPRAYHEKRFERLKQLLYPISLASTDRMDTEDVSRGKVVFTPTGTFVETDVLRAAMVVCTTGRSLL